LRAEDGIEAEDRWLEMEVVGETGRFWEAAVDGLRSWWGEGSRLRDADWTAEVISAAMLCDMLG